MRELLSYLNHIVAREITNGMWFLASVFLLATLVKFLYPILSRDPRVWNHDIDVKLAWGVGLIALGTSLRAGWIWALLVADDYGNAAVAHALESIGLISYVALGLGVWGAICTTKAITEGARRPGERTWIYWLFMITVTLGLPIALHVL